MLDNNGDGISILIADNRGDKLIDSSVDAWLNLMFACIRLFMCKPLRMTANVVMNQGTESKCGLLVA